LTNNGIKIFFINLKETNALLKPMNEKNYGGYFCGGIRSRALMAVGFGIFTGLTAWGEFRKSQPIPLIYGESYVNTPNSPGEFRYPKYEIKFSNSQAPMLLKEIYLTSENGERIPIEKAFFGFKTSKMTSNLFFTKQFGEGRRWNTEGIVPIITFHPNEDADIQNNQWFLDLISEMKSRKLVINVEYCWLHSITRIPSIYSIPFPPDE
jgi:hypothetical protein